MTGLLVRAAITGIVLAVVAVVIFSLPARGSAAVIVASVIQRKHGATNQGAEIKKNGGRNRKRLSF